MLLSFVALRTTSRKKPEPRLERASLPVRGTEPSAEVVVLREQAGWHVDMFPTCTQTFRYFNSVSVRSCLHTLPAP
eukprot:2513399-Amphidinium_carterae.2